MYQNYQQTASQNQLGSANTSSQNRGMGIKYQPIGNVPSQYDQSVISSFSRQNGLPNNSQYSNLQNPQSSQTVSYRGNQQGQNAYLRADSTQPAQSQFGGAGGSFNRNPY